MQGREEDPIPHIAHCDLCKHQVQSPQGGYMCGLTQERPRFSTVCATATFADKAETTIKQVNIAHDKVIRSKPLAMVKILSLLALGSSIVGYSAYLHYLTSGGASAKGQVTILGAGLLLFALGLSVFGLALKAFAVYRSEYLSTKSRKKQIDTLLKRYAISYTIQLVPGKKYHGEQDYSAEIDFSGR